VYIWTAVENSFIRLTALSWPKNVKWKLRVLLTITFGRLLKLVKRYNIIIYLLSNNSDKKPEYHRQHSAADWWCCIYSMSVTAQSEMEHRNACADDDASVSTAWWHHEEDTEPASQSEGYDCYARGLARRLELAALDNHRQQLQSYFFFSV